MLGGGGNGIGIGFLQLKMDGSNLQYIMLPPPWKTSYNFLLGFRGINAVKFEGG